MSDVSSGHGDLVLRYGLSIRRVSEREDSVRERVIVLDGVQQRHPDVAPEDAMAAWDSVIASRPRLDADPLEYVAIGVDAKGRLLELVVVDAGTAWVVKHAQTPPQEPVRRELGFGR